MAMRRRPVQDSPVLRRRLARRLRSAFLRLRFEAAKPVGVFDASHLEWMLRSGNPDDAYYYLECFLHRVPVPDRISSPLSYELIAHIGAFKTLAKVAAGGKEGAAVAALFANPSDYFLRSPASVRLHKMIAVMHADGTRASNLWEILKPQALDAIMGLVDRCPELQGEPRLTRKKTLPLEAASRRVLQCRGHRWKTTKWAPSGNARTLNTGVHVLLDKSPERCYRQPLLASPVRAPTDVLVRKFLQKRQRISQGRKLSEFPSNASSPEELSTRSEQIASKAIKLAGQPMENLERASEKTGRYQV